VINTYQGHIENFLHWAENTPKNIFLKQPKGNQFKDYSFAQAAEEVSKMGTYLRRNFNDDKKHVGIISKNCAHWVLADLAILYAGGVSVPFYPTLTGEQFKDVYIHSDCQILFVGKLDNWEEIKTFIPEGTVVIHMSDQPNEQQNTWEQIILKEKKIVEPHSFQKDEVISIIYTSGTTGTPKGVMITSGSVLIGLEAAREIAFLNEKNNRFISYLPLSHVAERNLVEFAATASGGTIYFVENLQTFAANLQAAEPTHFLAVPRIWLKFQETILLKFKGQKNLDRIKSIPIIGKLVIKLIVKKLGLSKAKLVVTGAAPISADLLNWYQGMGLFIQEAYGMTENLGLIAVMPRNEIKLGTVGKPWDICEVRIEDSEIQIKSKYNTIGYYKNPKATQEIYTDEWLKTGDSGILDSDGYLKIIGRIKDNFKTSKGFYVSPATLENEIQTSQLIDQVCVVGADLPEPMALIILSPLALELAKEDLEKGIEEIHQDLIPKFKHYEMIKKFVVLTEPWTVENNCMTPTLKIKRLEIEKIYQRHFEDWFKHKNLIIYS